MICKSEERTAWSSQGWWVPPCNDLPVPFLASVLPAAQHLTTTSLGLRRIHSQVDPISVSRNRWANKGKTSMEYRQLGNSGIKVSVLSFGTGTFGGNTEFFRAWGQTDVEEARRLVDICLDGGINLFDTADVYSNG